MLPRNQRAQKVIRHEHGRLQCADTFYCAEIPSISVNYMSLHRKRHHISNCMVNHHLDGFDF